MLVARNFRDPDGQSEAPFWIWSDANGNHLPPPAIVQMSFCGMPSVGRVGARLNPTGAWFVFWYICEYGVLGGWASTNYVQVNTPRLARSGSGVAGLL